MLKKTLYILQERRYTFRTIYTLKVTFVTPSLTRQEKLPELAASSLKCGKIGDKHPSTP